MKIKWHGHSCMELISGECSVVIDPFSPGYVPGISPIELTADMVLCSHGHGDHNYTEAVTIVKHDTCPFTVTAVPAFHDDCGGIERGSNTIHIIEAEGLRAVHLGDLGHLPDEEQIRAIGNPDVLMIPVGGFYTIDAETAKKVCDMLSPKVIIPMHYRSASFGFDVLGTVDDFTNLFPNDAVRRYDTNSIEVTKDTPNQVAVLTYIK